MTEYTNFIWDEPEGKDISERKCKITIDGTEWSNVYINNESEINKYAKQHYDDGNQPEAYVAPVDPIPAISRKQVRLWLLSKSITSDMVVAAINQIPDAVQKETAKIEWEDSSTYVYDHPLILQMAAAFNIPIESLPQAFKDASKL